MTRALPFCLAIIALAAVTQGTIRADIIISAENSKAAQGLSGNLEILLENTGTGPVSIGAFSFGISTGNPTIDFTGASLPNGLRYIFQGNSFDEINGLPLATTTGTALNASDAANNGVPVSIAGSGTIVSLGDVSYLVAPSAALGPVKVIFSPAETSLSNGIGNPLYFETVNGKITVTPIPEPYQIPLLIGCLGALSLAGKQRRSLV